MKRIVSLLVIGVFLATSTLSASGPETKRSSGAQATAAQASTPADVVKNADGQLRSTIASEMVKEATKRGLSIQADKIVYATRDDVIAANTGLQGIENITDEQLASGADVGFVYVSLPPEAGIATGYYTVRLFLTPGASSGTAQLIDGAGNVAAQMAVQNDAAAAFIKIVFTIIIGRNFICFDFHFRVGRFSISAILCIGWFVVAGN
jgi:hypothetical protein